MSADPNRRTRLELDGAIRSALVDWQDTPGEPNYQWRSSALHRALFGRISEWLDAQRPTTEQVAAALKANHGIVRVSEYAHYGPVLIEPEQLADAYRLLADDPDLTDEQREHARHCAAREPGAW